LQLVSYLGIVIFHALDFGLSEEEERHLSPDLERLIDMMTAAGKLRVPICHRSLFR
jgi:spire-like protein